MSGILRLLALLVFVWPGGVIAQTGSLSTSPLAYSLVFHPASAAEKAHFHAILQNTSGRTLRLGVNDTIFSGFIEADGKEGAQLDSRVHTKTFRTMMLTGAYVVPARRVSAGQSIEWMFPLDTLQTLAGENVGPTFLHGSLVSGLDVSIFSGVDRSVRERIQLRSDPITTLAKKETL